MGLDTSKIQGGYAALFSELFSSPLYTTIKEGYAKEEAGAFMICPRAEDTYNAFSYADIDSLRVVILGQDPYHSIGGDGPIADGLAFSTREAKTPPSLRNIKKEISRDLGIKARGNDLSPLARQGVLLLNALLSVRANEALSHKVLGWERLTDAMIGRIGASTSGVAFCLWGRYAMAKEALIDTSRGHIVLRAPHPSPLARGFVGCGHFSRINAWLKERGRGEIDWQI